MVGSKCSYIFQEAINIKTKTLTTYVLESYMRQCSLACMHLLLCELPFSQKHFSLPYYLQSLVKVKIPVSLYVFLHSLNLRNLRTESSEAEYISASFQHIK